MKLVNKCILSRFVAPGFCLALRANSHEVCYVLSIFYIMLVYI